MKKSHLFKLELNDWELARLPMGKGFLQIANSSYKGPGAGESRLNVSTERGSA